MCYVLTHSTLLRNFKKFASHFDKVRGTQQLIQSIDNTTPCSLVSAEELG